MIGILQVVGLPEYREVKYIIEGEGYRSKLSSFAVKEWLKKEGLDAKICLLVPESLAERLGEPAKLLKDREEFKERVLDKMGAKVEVEIVPSVGEYSCTIFEGSVENIIVCIFKKLIEEGFDVIYGDVSTGQNIYTVSMVEAIRMYVTYRKLSNILQDGDFNFELIFSPPVIKDVDKYALEFHKQDVKVFFSLPKANVYKICKTGQGEINVRYSHFIKELGKCLNTLRIAFNAIAMNTPLAFYHREILDLDIDIASVEKDLLKIVNEALKPEIQYGKKVTVRRKIVDINNIANIFYSLSMLKSIKEFARDLAEPYLGDMLKNFSKVYLKLGLSSNVRFLQNEVQRIKEIVPDGFKGLYIECFKEGHGKSSDSKRNFFAHCGFLREVTFIEKIGGRVKAWWDKDRTIEIRSWIYNPT